MLDGVILLWFVLTVLALLFVAIDSRSTPASPVLKWGFVLLTAYTGVFGAFLYILGCREPLPGTHEDYVHSRSRQVLGSTMHCVAGDGIGILAGAAISTIIGLRGPSEVLLEYVLGFAFGWTIFQSLFMRDMAGGSYKRALGNTFVPELLSMNLLMAGMIPTMMILRAVLAPTAGADAPAFWFVMSMALLVGFITAYPMNWWLVANGLKHGMLTVRRAGTRAAAEAPVKHDRSADANSEGNRDNRRASTPSLPAMTLASFIALTVGAVIAWLAVWMPGG